MKGVMKIEYEQDSERRCENETTAKKESGRRKKGDWDKKYEKAYFKGILFTYCILSCFLFSCLLFVFVVHAFTFTKMAALLISCVLPAQFSYILEISICNLHSEINECIIFYSIYQA